MLFIWRGSNGWVCLKLDVQGQAVEEFWKWLDKEGEVLENLTIFMDVTRVSSLSVFESFI